MTGIREDGPRNRILEELHSIQAELERALGADPPSRDGARGVARKYRALATVLTEAEPLSSEVIIAVGRAIGDARNKVVQAFGQSAWDEPEAPPRTAALPAVPGLGRTPISESELDGIVLATDAHQVAAPTILRLVSEVRRLRSDEWLRAAADVIAMRVDPARSVAVYGEIMETLRKHRDGGPQSG